MSLKQAMVAASKTYKKRKQKGGAFQIVPQNPVAFRTQRGGSSISNWAKIGAGRQKGGSIIKRPDFSSWSDWRKLLDGSKH